jgi:Bifunctional DNA primase/polymerase, N-terminal
VAGGNLGLDVGRSGLIAIDSEDERATAVLLAAGYIPTVITAKSQDSTSKKRGGAHFYFRRPEGVDADTLSVELGAAVGGGKVDVMAAPTNPDLRAARFIVAPWELHRRGARLSLRFPPGRCHRPGFADRRSELPPGRRSGDSCGTGGDQRMPRAPRPPRIHPDPHADRITQEIDAISWDEWLAEDARTAVFGLPDLPTPLIAAAQDPPSRGQSPLPPPPAPAQQRRDATRRDGPPAATPRAGPCPQGAPRRHPRRVAALQGGVRVSSQAAPATGHVTSTRYRRAHAAEAHLRSVQPRGSSDARGRLWASPGLSRRPGGAEDPPAGTTGTAVSAMTTRLSPRAAAGSADSTCAAGPE